MLTGTRFRLERASLVLSDDNGKRCAVQIPLGSIVRVVSEPTEADKLVDIVCDEKVYSMFVEDLTARGTQIEDNGLGLQRV